MESLATEPIELDGPWSERPRAELFGPLRLTFRCRTLAWERWPGSRARSLMAWLLVRQGEALPCARAIETLWSELAPEEGRRALRRCLQQLRFAMLDLLGLPGQGVVRCRQEDTLALEHTFETDLQDFEEAAERALRARQAQEALRLASRADLDRRLLEGLEDSWAGATRQRLSLLRARLLLLSQRTRPRAFMDWRSPLGATPSSNSNRATVFS